MPTVLDSTSTIIIEVDYVLNDAFVLAKSNVYNAAWKKMLNSDNTHRY